MNVDRRRCLVEIDLDQFRENYRLTKEAIPRDCKLMVVLKGNAYGHGAVRIAKELEKEKEDWIGVASLGEAMELRQAGISKEILILGYTPPGEAVSLAELNLTQAIISYDYACALAGEAGRASVTVKGHLAVDTGMSRIGLVVYGKQREKSLAQAEQIYGMKQLEIGGIFTHFSSAYGISPEDEAYTRLQYERFRACCGQLKEKGVEVGLRHCNNSPSIINYPEYAMDMCRGGTLLFGFLEKKNMKRKIDLSSVMCFKTIVTMVKEIEDGSAISYNRTAVAKGDRKLAVLGVGWYDGYPRKLANIGQVLIGGKRYPIVGNVCMDLCMADITGNDDIKAGDEVVLMGKQGGDEIECWELYAPLGMGAGSISGGLSTRVPRVYLKNGKEATKWQQHCLI